MLKFIFVYLRYFNAFLIRIFLVILSEILSKYNITYTDIDYFVFSDGAKHILNLESPYKRETYRYTPLLALMMIPNQIININCGKIIFVFIDILNGICIEILLNLQNYKRKIILEEKENRQINPKEIYNPKMSISNIETKSLTSDSSSMISKKTSSIIDQRIYSNIFNLRKLNTNLNENEDNKEEESVYEKLQKLLQILDKIIDNPFATTSLFYLYNPFMINISTRGSADCIIILFILLTLIFLELGIYSISGVFFGLAIHFKIYPVIYCPAILLYIITRRKHISDIKLNNDKDFEIKNDKNINDNIKQKSLIERAVKFFLTLFCFYFFLSIASTLISKLLNIYKILFLQVKNLIKFFFKYIFNFNAIVFFGFALFTFLNLFLIFYLFLGQKFVYEYLLYHIVRKDHRHNYSVFSYLMYLIYTTNFGKILSLMAFLPQALLVIYCSLFLFKDLNICLTIITWIFVTFNKVVTAQYYLWYLSLVPLIMPFNRMFLDKKIKCGILFALWFYFEIYWNTLSHRLEYKGENLFLEIMGLNFIFFLINCVIVEELASDNINIKRAILY